jgi:hypothetical protein
VSNASPEVRPADAQSLCNGSSAKTSSRKLLEHLSGGDPQFQYAEVTQVNGGLNMKRIMLLTVLAFVIEGSAAQVKAADCSVNVSTCIGGNQGKPNVVAKCQAAKTGTFIGPFSGQTYQGTNRCGRWGCET